MPEGQPKPFKTVAQLVEAIQAAYPYVYDLRKYARGEVLTAKVLGARVDQLLSPATDPESSSGVFEYNYLGDVLGQPNIISVRETYVNYLTVARSAHFELAPWVERKGFRPLFALMLADFKRGKFLSIGLTRFVGPGGGLSLYGIIEGGTESFSIGAVPRMSEALIRTFHLKT